VRRQQLHSRDPAEITSYLNRVYSADVRLQALGRRRGLRLGLEHSRTGSGSFALEDIRQDGDVEIYADATTPCLVVLWTVEGRAESHVHGQDGLAAPGQMLIGSTTVAPVRVRTSDATMKSLVLDRTLLAKAAADLAPERPPNVSFTGVEPVSEGAGRALTAARRYVETVLAEDGLATPLVLAAAGRLLAATALSAFPNAVGSSDGSHDRSDGHPVLLRRAMGYMEEHAAEDLGIGDVASAVYVTPRALQYMFRRHLDSTPMAYLRRVRLDHVHRDLITGNRGATTVTATAARWGFAHTGRFAVLYRETYGQSPHVTLRC
jgi:AraC-like DNA-binding protein